MLKALYNFYQAVWGLDSIYKVVIINVKGVYIYKVKKEGCISFNNMEIDGINRITDSCYSK